MGIHNCPQGPCWSLECHSLFGWAPKTTAKPPDTGSAPSGSSSYLCWWPGSPCDAVVLRSTRGLSRSMIHFVSYSCQGYVILQNRKTSFQNLPQSSTIHSGTMLDAVLCQMWSCFEIHARISLLFWTRFLTHIPTKHIPMEAREPEYLWLMTCHFSPTSSQPLPLRLMKDLPCFTQVEMLLTASVRPPLGTAYYQI